MMIMEVSWGLDVIGDVHGEIESLVALLTTLGYRNSGGAWRHTDRTAVFVGDLIDRGPGQVEVVELVRSMYDAGTAQVCMGNHEWNAIAWTMKDPTNPGAFLRDHGSGSKRAQHEAFLAQVGEGSARHREFVSWFAKLPLWLDLPGLRVVHACWQESQLAHLQARGGGYVTEDLLVGAHISGSADHVAIETTLKGIEANLPNGLTFRDKGGHERREARIKWWAPEPRTFRNAVLVEGAEVLAQLPSDALPSDVVEVDVDDRPVIFGHYWAKGTPTLQSSKAVCVDYSATLGGSLVAYRWTGETELDEANLVSVAGARRG
jgi:Calcineurin-like phosphoesterase